MCYLFLAALLLLAPACASMDTPTQAERDQDEMVAIFAKMTPQQQDAYIAYLEGLVQSNQVSFQNSLQMQMLWEMHRMNGNPYVPGYPPIGIR